MLVTSQLTIDLNYRDFNRYLYATQNDGNTRAVEITLLSDRSPWTVPADAVGAVSFKKPDKTAGLYDTLPDGKTQAVQVSGNKLTAILAPQVLTAAGDVSVSIVLFDKVLNRLGTFPFTLRVAADPSGGQSVSNDYYAFKTLGELNAAILGHTENKNNPHGVTLEQIGAAPAGLVSTMIYPKTYAAFMEELKSIYANMPNTKNTPKKFMYAGIETGGDVANGELGSGTWFIEINRSSANYGTIKASNEYYGDYKLVIYGTWGKWVDVSEKAFTPSSHLNDKNNPHGVTLAQIGAAPAGYGLGEKVGRYCADCWDGTQLGFYDVDGNTANLPNGVTGGVLLVEGKSTTYNYGVDFYLTLKSGVQIWHCYYSSWAGQWQPWECENPPMLLGVEYRTTERNTGSAVYAKRISYSVAEINAASAAVDISIPHEISNFAYLVRLYCAKDSYVLPYLKDNGGFTAITGANSTNITLRANKATWAASTWLIDIYYVKH